MSERVPSNKGKILVMNDINVATAANMARYLVNHEHKGLGDTTEAAINRIAIKQGISPSIISRLIYRKMDDMLLSNFAAVVSAYQAACISAERQIEHERSIHETFKTVLRAADFVAGSKAEREG